jgi:hypothetical protein
MAGRKTNAPLTFALSNAERKAIETLAGGRGARLSGRVRGGNFRVDFVACNSAFLACNTAFTPCNAAFTACNTAFTACNAAFAKKSK